MTRGFRNTYLANVSLPFDDRERVTPYDEYLRFLVPAVDQTPTTREWQAGSDQHTGTGAGVTAIIAPTPDGFQDTYIIIGSDLSVGPNVGLAVLQSLPLAAPNDFLPVGRFTAFAHQFNFLSDAEAGNAADGSVRFIETGPGQGLHIVTTGALAVGQVLTVKFLRYRVPGPTIRGVEARDADIIIS